MWTSMTKGIALPAVRGARSDTRALRSLQDRGDSTWSRSTRALDILRYAGADGAVTALIAKYLHESVAMTNSVLIKLRKRAEVLSDITDDGETRWYISRKKCKQHADMVERQSAEAMGWLRDWTISSICARMKAGIVINASYPYIRVTEQ